MSEMNWLKVIGKLNEEAQLYALKGINSDNQREMYSHFSVSNVLTSIAVALETGLEKE